MTVGDCTHSNRCATTFKHYYVFLSCMQIVLTRDFLIHIDLFVATSR